MSDPYLARETSHIATRRALLLVKEVIDHREKALSDLDEIRLVLAVT